MTFINHLGLWLLLIFIGNAVELTNKNPFDNVYCNGWYIPTICMSILFGVVELLILIYYMILVW